MRAANIGEKTDTFIFLETVGVLSEELLQAMTNDLDSL